MKTVYKVKADVPRDSKSQLAGLTIDVEIVNEANKEELEVQYKMMLMQKSLINDMLNGLKGMEGREGDEWKNR